MKKIRVPFKFGRFLFEKDIDFLFRIATLESACVDILKCELHELDEQNPSDINIAVLYAAYALACEKKRSIKKYSLLDAAYWAEHMSKTSHDVFLESVKELIGKMSKVSEQKKK